MFCSVISQFLSDSFYTCKIRNLLPKHSYQIKFISIILQYEPTETDPSKLQQLFKIAKTVMKSRSDKIEEAMDEMEKEAKRNKKKGWNILSSPEHSKVSIVYLCCAVLSTISAHLS